MIRAHRPEISGETKAWMSDRQKEIDESDDAREATKKAWDKFSNSAARKEVVRLLNSMSPGLNRCIYCEDSMGTDIDHFRPKSDYPSWTFIWHNYYLACSYCNSNQKRNRFPIFDDGSPAIVDPALDEPTDHLFLSPRTGMYVHRTEKGRHTIELFGLNREVCVKGRQHAWCILEALVRAYCDDLQERVELMASIRESPFQGVREQLRYQIENPNIAKIIGNDYFDKLVDHPEILR